MNVRRAVGIALVGPLLGAGLMSPALAVEAGLDSPPVLDLGFEDTTDDSSENANDVTLRGHNGSEPTGYAYVDGVAEGSRALSLTGNTYLDLGSSTDLQPENLTLSFWINPTAALTGEQVITWNKGAYNTDGWYLSSESDTSPLAVSVGPATGQPYKVRVASANRAEFFPAGEWTHVAMTYDSVSKDVAFYRNGERVPSTVANSIGGDATGVLGSSEALPKTIGFNGPLYNGAYLNAALDEYKVYNGVATLGDVVGLYEESGRQIDRLAIAQSDADALSLPATATLGLVLATTGSRGSDISWTSSDPEVIDALGVVTRPEEGSPDAEVTLTAHVWYLDGEVVEREFVVLVPADGGSDLLGESGLNAVQLSDTYLTNAAAKEHEYLCLLYTSPSPRD